MSGCIFCAIIAKDAPSWTVYEDEHAIAFMDINPATDGHVLVVPRRHVKDLWEIGERDAGQVMEASVRVAAMIKRALEPDGMNILHATGAVAFQTVFHFHLHLVPRTRGDSIKLPWIPRPGEPSRIAAVAERITATG
ncbi:MAG: HIT family protein [Actinomycetota bacterium]|nr:HIT family protein [Actinomycetota bacterium]